MKKYDTAKINLPLGQAWLLLSILLDITAGTLNIAKEFRKLKRQKPQIFSSQPRAGSDQTFEQTTKLPTLFILT